MELADHPLRKHGLVYVSIADLTELIGDLISNRMFSATSSPITLGRAEGSIIRASVHVMNSIQPLRIPTLGDTGDPGWMAPDSEDDYDTLLLYDSVKTTQLYQSAIMAMDTIAATADPSAGGEQGNTQSARKASRRAEYQRTYNQFILGLKTQLQDFRPTVARNPARFKVGQDFGSVPRDYRYYEPFVTFGGSPVYQGNPGYGPSFYSRN